MVKSFSYVIENGEVVSSPNWLEFNIPMADPNLTLETALANFLFYTEDENRQIGVFPSSIEITASQIASFRRWFTTLWQSESFRAKVAELVAQGPVFVSGADFKGRIADRADAQADGRLISIDFSEIGNVAWINSRGVVISSRPELVLAHELIHLGADRNSSGPPDPDFSESSAPIGPLDFDYDGPAVDFQNKVAREIAEFGEDSTRISYWAGFFDDFVGTGSADFYLDVGQALARNPINADDVRNIDIVRFGAVAGALRTFGLGTADRPDVLDTSQRQDSSNDLLLGFGDGDTLKSGAGDDVLHGFTGSDILNGGDGNDLLFGGEHNDILDGGAGDDVIIAGDGEDTIIGGRGVDFIDGDGESPISTALGFGANDTLTYADADFHIVIRFREGEQTPNGQGNRSSLEIINREGDGSAAMTIGTDTVQNVESIIGSSFADVIQLDRNTRAGDLTNVKIDLGNNDSSPGFIDSVNARDFGGQLKFDLRNKSNQIISGGSLLLVAKGVSAAVGTDGEDEFFGGIFLEGGAGPDKFFASDETRVIFTDTRTEGGMIVDNSRDEVNLVGREVTVFAGRNDDVRGNLRGANIKRVDNFAPQVTQVTASGPIFGALFSVRFEIPSYGFLLTGGTEEEAGSNSYISADGTTYVLQGSDLLVSYDGGSLTVGDFRNGLAGIRLIDAEDDDDDGNGGDGNGGDGNGGDGNGNDEDGGGGRPDFDPAERNRDPLIIDLDGDRNVITARREVAAYFDLDNDGFAERVAWSGANDGFLVRDLNGNGTIDSGNEMFGTGAVEFSGGNFERFGEDGFIELALLDSNFDGFITAADAQFGELKVWIDANLDAVTDEGELVTLDDLGIVSISLQTFASDHIAIVGDTSFITRASTVGFADGSTTAVYDAYLSIDQFDSRERLDDLAIDPRVADLPFLLGSGNVSDLDIAMSRDAGLAELVRELAELDIANAHQILAKTQQIVLRWTGADQIAPDSRGPNVTAQWLHALEAVTGEDFSQRFIGANPRADAGTAITREWQQFIARTAARLVGQTDLGQALTPGLSFAAAAFFTVSGDTNFASVVSNLAANAPSERGKAISYWAGAIAILRQYRSQFELVGSEFESLIDAALSDAGVGFTARELGNVLIASQGEEHVVGQSLAIGVDDLILLSAGATGVKGGTGDDVFVAARGTLGASILGGRGLDTLLLADHTASQISATLVTEEGRTFAEISGDAGDLDVRVELDLRSDDVGSDIEFIAFADGSRIELLELFGASQLGSGIVLGDQSIEIIEGSAVDETLIGIGGSNTYRWGAGFGNDRVVDRGGSDDRVIIDADLAEVSISLDSSEGFSDVVIEVTSTGETLRVRGQRSSPSGVIESFEFRDRTLSLAELDAIFNTGGSGDDLITGSVRGDQISGGAGNDILRGGAGIDNYLFSSGWGEDRIFEENAGNTVTFGAGIEIGDITAERGGDDSLVLRSATGDLLTILGGLRAPVVSLFLFADGSSKQLTEFIAELSDLPSGVVQGTPNDETLTGSSASESLIGGGGRDTYFGNGGTDFYEINGPLSVVNGSSVGIDTVLAPVGVSLSDLRIDENFGFFGNSGFNIRFVQSNIGIRADSQIDFLSLRNGGFVDFNSVGQTVGDARDNFLYQFGDSSVTFAPGAGDDVIIGSSSSSSRERYDFEVGFGSDIIYDLGGFETVRFLSPELSAENATFDRIDNNLVISFTSGDRLTVEGYFWRHLYEQSQNFGGRASGTIENIFFGGVSNAFFSSVSIRSQISSQTDGDDWVLIGSGIGSSRDGGAGNDILAGGTEDNFYVFGRGYDNDIIKDDGGSRDQVRLIGIELADISVSRDAIDPYSVVLTVNSTGDTLTIDGTPQDGFLPDWHILSDFREWGMTIEEFRFDSETVSGAVIIDLALASSASDGDDTILGLNSEGTINGGRGNDRIDIGNGRERIVIGPDGGHDVIRFSGDGSQPGRGGAPFHVEFSGIEREDLVFIEVNEVDGIVGRHLRIIAGDSSATIVNGLDARFNQFGNEVGFDSRFQISADDGAFGFGGFDFDSSIIIPTGRISSLTQGTDGVDFLQADPSVLNVVIDPLAGDDVIFGSTSQDRVIFDVGYGVDRYLSNGGSLTVEVGDGLTGSDIALAWSQSEPGLIELSIIGTQDRLLFDPEVLDRILVGGEVLTTFDLTTLPTLSVDPDGEITAQPSAERIIATGGSASIVIGAISGADFIEDARFEAAVDGTDDLTDWSPNTLIIEGVSDVDQLRFLIEDRDPATLIIEKPNGERITLTNQFGLGLPEFVEGLRSPDLDGDGTPDWDRIDFDNDGTPDFAVLDTNADGVPDWLDADYDGDGASDWIDVANAKAIFAGGDVFAQDFDLDGNFDSYFFSLANSVFSARDINGDGIADEYSEDELVWTPAPTNLSGEVDWSLLDLDGDGIADLQGFADGTGPTWLRGFDPQVGNPDWSVTVYGELSNAEGDFIAERFIDLATGATDYVVFGRDSVFVPPFFFAPGTNYLARDVDGDGAVDLVGFDSDGDGQPDSALDQSSRAVFASFVLRDTSSPFGDEFTLSLADILERIEFVSAPQETFVDLDALRPIATNQSDNLLLGTADELDSLGGDDVITSYGEGGTFRWSAGDGNDVFRSTLRFPLRAFGSFDDQGTDLDTIRFEGILDPAQLRFTVSTNDPSDLVVEIIATGERLTIEGQLGPQQGSQEWSPPVGRFVFDGGLELTGGEVAARVFSTGIVIEEGVQRTGVTGGLLDAGAGAVGEDTLLGGPGDDIYRFGRDYGEDTIRDAGGTDTVHFGPDITPDDLFFSRIGENGEDLLVEVLGLDRLALTITGQFAGSGSRIELFSFEDGSRLTAADVQRFILDVAETGGDDTINGFLTDDIIRGGRGNDVLSGGGGNDQIFGGEGRDQALFTGASDEYVITFDGETTTVTDTVAGRDGVTRLQSIEDLVFRGDSSTTQLVPKNVAPTASGLSLQVDEDATLLVNAATLLAAASDSNGDSLRIVSVSEASNGQVWIGVDGNVRFLADADFSGDAGFDFSVSDGNGGITTARASVSVIGSNDAPRIAISSRTFTTFEDNPIDWVLPAGSISDPDGDALTISARLSSGDPLPDWLIFDGSRFTGTPPSDFNGTIDIELTAEDGSAIASTSLQIEILPINDAPRQVNELPDRELRPGEAFAFTLPTDAFFDVEGDPISFEVVAGDGGTLPTWITLDGLNVSGTVPEGLIDPVLFALIASDGAAANLATFAIVPVLNTGPQIGIPLQSISSDEDELFSFTLPADAFVDADGDTLSLSAALANGDPLPIWLSFDNATFSGVPPQDFSGSLEIVVSASDGQLSASQSLTVTIDPVNDAPIVVAPLGDVTVQGGEALSINLGDGTFGDVDGDTLTFSASLADGSALPVWLSFDGTSFTAASVPLLAQQLQVIVTASDGLLTGSDEFLLTVEAGNTPPIANDDGVFFTTSNRALVVSPDSLLANDSDPQGGALQITGVQNAVGGEVRFDADGNIVFTPDAVFVGNASFTYTLSDGELASEAVVSVTVDPSDQFDGFRQGNNNANLLFGSLFGRNRIFGAGGNDIITGGLNNDELAGGDGDDVIFGLLGNDNLWGGQGNDQLFGGLGYDRAFFSGSRSTYQIVTSGGAFRITDTAPGIDGDDGVDQLFSIEQLVFKGGETLNIASPIILDLDGNGIEAISAADSNARFDLDGDGLADDTSWIGAGDAFLYLDRDANGTVSGVEELSFVDDLPDAATDLAGLRAFDSNGDGILDARDERFADFGVWRDADGDGAVDEGETASLATVGIRSINLNGTPVEAVTEFGEVAIANTGTFTLTNGTTRTFADAALTYFSAATNLPSLGVTHYDFGRKASKYRISAAGGALTVAPKNAGSGRDPLAGQLGANSILSFRGRDYGMFAPIVLDLDGDGIELVSRKKSRASFDYGGDGAEDDTGWIGRDDGFLVIDRNNDGLITEASELSLASEDEDARSGLEGLARLDSNGDGVIDNRDARFSELRVWQDRNGNGRTDAGELRSLEEAGIVASNLTTITPTQAQVKLDRNVIAATTTFVRANGTTSTAADVSLAYRPVSARNVAATSFTPRLDRFGTDIFRSSFWETGFEREALLPSVDELATMLGRADPAGVTDIFDRISAAAAAPPMPLAQQVTIVPQVTEAWPLPPRVFDPASLYFSMYDLATQATWRGGVGELVEVGALTVMPVEAGQIADVWQFDDVASAKPVAANVAENVDQVTPDTLTDEIPAVPSEPRRLLDRSGHEFWGGPEWVGSLLAPEGSSEATQPSVVALPVASSNLPDAQNEVTPPKPAQAAVIDPPEALADTEVAIAPPTAAQEDRPRLDPAQHELWGGPLRVSFIPTPDDGEGAGSTVEAPASKALHGPLDAEIARKLAMIRQDLSTFGATGVGEIERLRQLPAQAMDIFA